MIFRFNRIRWAKSTAIVCLCLLANCTESRAVDPKADNTTLNIGGGQIQVSIPSPLPINSAAIMDWVQRAATAVTRFYGRYPVKNVLIVVSPADHGRVQGG